MIEKRKITINGKQMAYVEMGEGDPIIFQHGNPTSSYLWRNIMPHVKDLGRCIALDLIGMGDSDKLDDTSADSYTYLEHRSYFDAALEALGVREKVTLVIHDWGSALGFDWAERHRDAVKGICYMEAIVMPMTWKQWPDVVTEVFRGFRSPAGESMVLDENVFVENVFPGAVLRDMSEEEMAVYRKPFENPGEDRRPTLTWPRQIPLDGEPEAVVSVVNRYGAYLAQSDVRKLFINAEPGAILTGDMRDFCRTWPNQEEVTVKGSHFIQEDSPDEIGQTLRAWMQSA